LSRRGAAGQRERLLSAVVSVANRAGYAHTSVSAIIEQAGVSRPTFYEHFSTRDACFLAAAAETRERLLGELHATLEGRPPGEALQATIGALVGFTAAQPAQAQFLFSETLAGGPTTLNARDETVAEIAEVLAGARARLEPASITPGLREEIVTGLTLRMLAARLRRGERSLQPIVAELLRWMDSYGQPADSERWRTPTPVDVALPSALVVGAPLRAPAALPPGRPRIPEEAVAENHRLRIMFATAELVQRDGYAASTIAQITRQAGVDGRSFHKLFADKEAAFTAIHELGFQRLMAATAAAFFTAEQWPARMWQALLTLSRWLELNPAVAHVGFVESYAVGPGAVQRVEDSLIAFTIFLREGYEQQTLSNPPSRLALEAIVTGVFETIYREVRRSSRPQVMGLAGELVHLSLTPFLGVAETDRFIESQLAAG